MIQSKTGKPVRFEITDRRAARFVPPGQSVGALRRGRSGLTQHWPVVVMFVSFAATVMEGADIRCA